MLPFPFWNFCQVRLLFRRVIFVNNLYFCSALNRLPSDCFVNFLRLHCMYVFAISAPYTNPYKYDHYIVSLAHHVIAGWFLKCRLAFRPNFVQYIIKGFETNVQIPFQEIRKMETNVQMPFQDMKKLDFATINEDSSNRKRSSSLTEQGSRRRERTASQLQKQTQQQSGAASSTAAGTRQPDNALYKFHMELAETCIDFLARHTFSPCSALPKRYKYDFICLLLIFISLLVGNATFNNKLINNKKTFHRLPSSEFILAGGQSMTWLVDHNLITITTSGCTAMQLKNGLCDRCSLICKQPMPIQPIKSDTSTSSSAAPAGNNTSQKQRYTKASLQHTR